MKRSVSATCNCNVAKKALMVFISCLLCGLFSRGSCVFATSQLTGHYTYRLPGVVIPLLLNHASLGLTVPSKVLSLSVHLSLRNQAGLETLLAAQANPKSSFYHYYLTPQTFKNQFGPTENAVKSVVTFLQIHHLPITSISANNLVIQTAGSVATVEKAFLIVMHDYNISGRTIYAPSMNPALPDVLISQVQNIVGLDNVATYAPRYRVPNEASPSINLHTGYTPEGIRTAYDVNPLFKTGANGAGQTVALFELAGYQPSDVDTYLHGYGLGPRKYSNVLIDGVKNTPGDGSVETTLDMEMISALAPDAMQKIYIGPNTTTGVNDIYNAIVSDNSAQIVSISWGQCEVATGNAEIETLHEIFQQGAAQGQSFFAASGDAGAYDCGDTSLSIDSPSDQPNVIGVGGTTLTTNKDNTYNNESAWSTISVLQPSSGGGGGLSFYFPRPANQIGIHLTDPHRMEPDVSANADPATGYSIFCTGSAAVCRGWITVGGTSAAAPLWAGIAADINQYLIMQKKSPIGNLNSALYVLYSTPQLYRPYHDVIIGTNLFYKATVGYDLATGIGSPDVWNFARDLAKITPLLKK